MTPSFNAFVDEMVKISHDQREVVDKDRLRRALQGGLAGVIGTGLGVATGHMAANLLDPRLVNLSRGQRRAALVGAGIAGGLVGLGQSRLRKQYLDYVRGGEG